VIDPLRKALERLPVVKPVLPDPGVPLQLVHTEDVAKAIAAATTGEGPPGIYNLAAPDELTISDIARELGWTSVPVPRAAISAAAAAIERAPLTPAIAEWVSTLRVPVLMDPTKAERELGIDWISARDTLAETVASARAKGQI
jgi:nucleoside-diphosphate-sugar epimerase